MKFTKQEIERIKEDKIFRKEINKKIFWVKPLYEHKTYPQGNHLNHKKFFRILKSYFKAHIPQFILKEMKVNNKKLILIIQENIKGKKLRLDEIKKLLKLRVNKNLKVGLMKLLQKEGCVLDFYVYYGNFIKSNLSKIMYIDSRMPIFCNKSEERYQISKKRTLSLLG